jgi:hypothetical protein
MKILEYMLDATENGLKTPTWIEDGGYWHNITDHTYIGLVQNSPDYHIPSTVNRLTAIQLEARQVSIHTATPIWKPALEATSAMTEAEVRTAVQNWVTDKGVN